MPPPKMPDPMAGAPAEPIEAAVPVEPVPPDLTQGYVIEIKVLGDGTFAVKQEPMEVEPAEAELAGEEAGESFDSINDALKAAIRIFKENPVGESEQASFEAGFAGGGNSTPPPAPAVGGGY